MVIKYLISKEFKQFRRNSFLPRLVIMFPIMTMLVMPWVTTMDIKNVRISIVDNDNSTTSMRLIEKISHSDYFKTNDVVYSYDDALEDMEYGRADIILDIPYNFEKDITNLQVGNVYIAANAVNGTKGSLGSSYLASIISGFDSKITIRNFYNQTLNYKQFMIPALIAVLIILLCGFLPALNIVSEKESGTIEQINVTPVGKFEFILAKLIPYWVIGIVVLTICFALSWLVYGYIPAGSFFVIYCGVVLFILVISSFGLIISNFSQTMQQSMLVMFFFMLIFNLMSGLFTPIRSMPEWAQYISACIPPKYFIEIMRGVYQRGCTFSDLWQQFITLGGFALLMGVTAILSYRKRS